MAEDLTTKMNSMVDALERNGTWDAYNSDILGKINPGSMDHTLWVSLGMLLEHPKVPDKIKERIASIMAANIIATEGSFESVEAKLKELTERVGRSSVRNNEQVGHSLGTVSEVVAQAKALGEKRGFAGKPLKSHTSSARKAYGK